MATGKNLTAGSPVHLRANEASEGQPAKFLAIMYILLTCAWQMNFGQAEMLQGLTCKDKERGSSLVYLSPQIQIQRTRRF